MKTAGLVNIMDLQTTSESRCSNNQLSGTQMLFFIRLTRNSKESRHSGLDNNHSYWVSVAENVVTSLAQFIGRQARRGTRLSRIPADQEVETLWVGRCR